MRLSQDAEEIATFYARMIEHEYTSKDVFNKNFFKDWRRNMTNDEREIITDLKKCNFRSMYEYFVQKSEERKAMSKEEKKVSFFGHFIFRSLNHCSVTANLGISYINLSNYSIVFRADCISREKRSSFSYTDSLLRFNVSTSFYVFPFFFFLVLFVFLSALKSIAISQFTPRVAKERSWHI